MPKSKYVTMTISLPQTSDPIVLRHGLERLAYRLGYTQGEHGVRAGRGSVGGLLEAIVRDDVKLIKAD